VPDPVAGSPPDRFLIAVGGGCLRNPVRKTGVTCTDCVMPVDGYERCYPCNSYRSRTGLADATAFLTYAVAGQDSKRPIWTADERTTMALLVAGTFMVDLSKAALCWPGMVTASSGDRASVTYGRHSPHRSSSPSGGHPRQRKLITRPTRLCTCFDRNRRKFNILPQWAWV
jgi:hypothetical protein